MIENIKELIVLYAPTVLCCVSSVVGFFKTAKQLKANSKEITESASITKLKNEIKALRETIACHNQYEVTLIEQNKEILQDHAEQKNEKIQEDLQDGKLS